MSISITRANARLRGSARALAIIGEFGVVLALAILGSSVLLRLATRLDGTDAAVSTLPNFLEHAVRSIHRFSAASVGLLAIAASLLSWMHRNSIAQARWPTAGVVLATLILAAIGPLTPGYRYAAVTLANVLCGSALLMSCWWLRETLLYPDGRDPAPTRGLVLAVLALWIHMGSGALGSAFQMRGLHWVTYLHVATAPLFVLAYGDVLWTHVGHGRTVDRLARPLTLLLVGQVCAGLALLWIDQQPIWLGVTHALASQLLAIGLISFAIRKQTQGT
ncbi:MAG: hypothetical protein ACR2I0_13730 [Rhodoferax sp.]